MHLEISQRLISSFWIEPIEISEGLGPLGDERQMPPPLRESVDQPLRLSTHVEARIPPQGFLAKAMATAICNDVQSLEMVSEWRADGHDVGAGGLDGGAQGGETLGLFRAGSTELGESIRDGLVAGADDRAKLGSGRQKLAGDEFANALALPSSPYDR